MSCDFIHWLIPDDARIRPSADALLGLVEALVQKRWALPNDARFCTSVDHSERPLRGRKRIALPLVGEERNLFRDADATDLVIKLVLPQPGVRDPFVRKRVEFDDGYFYSLIIERAGRDLGYVQRSFENVEEFGAVRCGCGQNLAFDLDQTLRSPIDSTRLRMACPACGVPFDVKTLRVGVKDGYAFGNRTRAVAGGATSAFAIGIDTDQDWPADDEPVKVRPAFRKLCEELVGCPLHEITELNA